MNRGKHRTSKKKLPLADAEATPNDSIYLWLENLDLGIVDDGPLSIGVKPENQVRLYQSTNAGPCTPHRYDSQVLNHYSSPTDSHFSDPTVFDSPIKAEQHITRREGNDARSTNSITTVEDLESRKSELGLAGAASASTIAFGSSEGRAVSTLAPESVNSYDPPSAEIPDCLVSDIPTFDEYESQPRLVWLTSCLQCTLAELPCSRHPRACSRCVRLGREDLCLVQRRKIDKERILGDVFGNQQPVLLRVKGDSPQIWEKKNALSEELLDLWQSRQDRKNWVLPINDGRRGYYKRRRRGAQAHPGEGIGRGSPHVLHLA